MEIKFSDDSINVVQGGPLEITTDMQDSSNIMTTCMVTPLSGNTSSCGNCSDDSNCNLKVNDLSPADKITIGTEVIGVQCSLMELDILVTSTFINTLLSLFHPFRISNESLFMTDIQVNEVMLIHTSKSMLLNSLQIHILFR